MTNPHLDHETLHVGAELGLGRVVVVAVHGRGQSPAYMLEHVAGRVYDAETTWLLPEAAGNSWYPLGFLAPLADNQPNLDHALEALSSVHRQLTEHGIRDSQIVWLGFSQGACLVSEWVARHPSRWGGLIAFTGGYIGEPGIERTIDGDLAGMPAYFAVGDHDEWVPVDRVEATVALFTAAGAEVRYDLLPGRPHEVSDHEIEVAQRIIRAVR
jgi:predicted esterase